MKKIIFITGVIIFVTLFIIDSPWSKKIWLAATILLSIISFCRIPIIYLQCQNSISSSILSYEMKHQWIGDYNRLFIASVISLMFYICFITVAYMRIKYVNPDADSIREYIVLLLSALLVIILYIISIAFAATHQIKGYDISYYTMQLISSAAAIIFVNSALYMKLSQ